MNNAETNGYDHIKNKLGAIPHIIYKWTKSKSLDLNLKLKTIKLVGKK